MPRKVNNSNTLLLAAALIFGLALISGANSAIRDISSWSDDDAKYTEQFHKSFPLDASGSFSLKNTNGNVHISTWNKNEVDISAVKTARKKEEDLKKVTIEIDARAGSVAVDTIYPKRILNNIQVSVEYEVKVPEGVRLEMIDTTNGSIELRGRYGDVKADTTNGEIILSGSAKTASLDTTNGDIKADSVQGRVYADTTNGSIIFAVTSVTDDIKADTTNGSIRVKLGGDVNAQLKAHTTNGTIEVDFPVTLQSISKRRNRIEGTIGKGGALLSLETTNGSITITK